MTDLQRLNVSLTKHGAHKVAALLKKYDKDEVLNHLWNSEPGINIESAQAKKTLSATGSNRVPDFWREAQRRGGETIDALVLLAITFSHHQLISAMQGSSNKAPFSGTIERGKHIDGKAFTNFAHIIEELGYSTEHSPEHVTYNLHRLFQINRLSELFVQLLDSKLKSAGWDKRNPIIEEAVRLRFHEVFSINEQQFRSWMSAGTLAITTVPVEMNKESQFFFNADDKPSYSPFIFRAGHNNKKTGTVKVAPSAKESMATLLHNEIQNVLFAELVAKFGEKSVGTEVDTGQGTSIDIVVKTDEFCWFYEIKTAPSVRACIRQALPQLLEYAYWHGNDDRADRLIIVAPYAITKEAERYLTFLRERFKLGIYYEEYRFPEYGR